MRRSRAPSTAPGTFFVAQSWADCITNMPGFNLRQAQVIIAMNPNNPERFRAKWIPVRVEKTRQNKRLEDRF
jgi:hypothetical protein